MPALFPDYLTFIACCLIMAGAQLIYATVGFGAGMFAVALMAMILPDLAGAVAVLLVLTFVTEVWVLTHAWRETRLTLLLGLVPTMAIGLWIGTQVLIEGSVDVLRRALGVVVAGAGVWFLWQERVPARQRENPTQAYTWFGVPAGLTSGVLGGLFGTGGPPAIIFLKAYGLSKGAFRATLLWYFLVMSLIRGGMYIREGLLGMDTLWAALWLLPASGAGTLIGMWAHHRLREHHFAAIVSWLLIVLGAMLLVGIKR